MKLIIAGSRTFGRFPGRATPGSVAAALECVYYHRDIAFMRDRMKRIPGPIDEVVSGCARGADILGELWAEANSIPVKRFPADWDRWGRSAGFRRNEEMARYADALAAFWDGKSRGTKHMIDFMLSLKKPAYVFTPTPEG